VRLSWLGSNLLAGLHFSHPFLWVANTLVQGASFSIVGVLISTLKDALGRERALSRTDPLTALPNSRAFYEEAGRILALCRRKRWPVTLAYLDLDNFKSVNDTLGHNAGDDLLCAVAERLRRAVRRCDHPARLGGDEFVVLLPELGPDAAAALERLRTTVADVVSRHGHVTISVGGVTFLTVEQDVDQMVHRADAQMYHAKAAGKNRVHHAVEAGTGAAERAVP
jgi:diguanylate cyclase (GGDEF)-like protein